MSTLERKRLLLHVAVVMDAVFSLNDIFTFVCCAFIKTRTFSSSCILELLIFYPGHIFYFIKSHQGTITLSECLICVFLHSQSEKVKWLCL